MIVNILTILQVINLCMQKSLIIIRHALSLNEQPGMKDVDRTLSVAGIQDASKLGKYMKIKKLFPDQIYCSHAMRALGTARIIIEQTGILNEKILINEELYQASVRILLKMINQCDEKINSLILIGHHPSVSYLCEYLSGKVIRSLPPAGMCLMHFENILWRNMEKGSGVLIEQIDPSEISF
jgi:phosphohistidine phosphatase